MNNVPLFVTNTNEQMFSFIVILEFTTLAEGKGQLLPQNFNSINDGLPPVNVHYSA